MWDLVLILLLGLVGYCGKRLASGWLQTESPALAMAMGLPLGLSWLILTICLTGNWLPFWLTLAGSIIVLGAAAYWAPPSATSESQSKSSEKFKASHRWLLILMIFCTLFYVHSTQLIGFSPDFWSAYPLTRSLIKGNLPPVNPYFPDLQLKGHLAQYYLTAALASVSGGDTLRTQWICEIILIVNSIFLWVLTIRRTQGQALAGIWGGLFIFLGINVGGKAGLMDAFDNSDLLVFLMLALLFVLFSDLIIKLKQHWPISRAHTCLLIICSTSYAMVCETYLLLVLLCFGAGAFLALRHSTSALKAALKQGLLVTTVSLGITAMLGSSLGQMCVWQYQNWSSPRPAASQDYLDNGQALSFHFPKEHFLAIRLGIDPYRRFSNALNTALFRHYRPILDDGGYSSIFGTKVLVLHWLPTWLAPLTILWAVYRRSTGGYMFAIFGVIAYLTPGIIDFGPIREAEYFRWEFAAGLAFSGLLAACFADLWEMRHQWKRPWPNVCAIALIVLSLSNLVGAQKLINNICIEAQKDARIAALVIWPFYPDSDQWLLEQPAAECDALDLEACQWLWQNSPSSSRTWFFRPKTSRPDSILRQAILAGRSGTLPIGSAESPLWLPLGTPPYLPNEATSVFLKTYEASNLACLNPDWLLLEKPLVTSNNEQYTRLIKQFFSLKHDRTLYLYKYTGQQFSNSVVDRNETVKVTTQQLPQAYACQAAVPCPIIVETNQNLAGWLKPQLMSAQKTVSSWTPVIVPINGQQTSAWFVPPLNEGDFQLSWLYSKDGQNWSHLEGQTCASTQFSKAIEDCLRVENVKITSPIRGTITLRNISQHDFYPGGPWRLQWQVWSPQLHNYRSHGLPEGETQVVEKIGAGQSAAIPWYAQEVVPAGGRIDVTAAAEYGQTVTIPRL